MFHTVFDVLFPKTCLFCNQEGSMCCEDCLSTIPIAQYTSPITTRSFLSGLYCATSYQEKFVQNLIHSFKYEPFLKDLAKPLAFLIVSHFALLNKQISPLDAICPIPLHKKRLKWRGYNHAERIATELGYAFSLPVITNVLLKTHHTSPQTHLTREQRLKNLKGAFQVQNQETIQGKNILLLDDVYTTGATMEECARLLRKAKAKQVFGAVVARD